MDTIKENISERLEELAKELREDIVDIIENGWWPANKFNEHLQELEIIADVIQKIE